MLRLGKDTIPCSKAKKGERTVKYCDIPKDQIIDGWISLDHFFPTEFDLVMLKTDKDKVIKGWYSGTRWDGILLKKTHVIKYWKKEEGYNESKRY